MPPRSDAPPRRRHRLYVAAALTIGLGLLALPVLLSDGRELLRTAAGIDPLALAAPVVLTLLSYAAMARSYQGIADAAGFELGFRDWLRITFVSNTANYLITSAGLSGFAVRMYLLSQHRLASGRAVLISLVQTFLTNFTLLVFVFVGFATLVARYDLSPLALTAASIAVAVFSGALFYGVVLIYHRRLRRRTLLWLAESAHRILRRVARRWTPGRVRLWRAQHNLNEGLEFLLSRKDRIAGPAAWIMLDWVLTIGILFAAFRAVHYPIAPGLVVIGFAIGICLSMLSFVPAGLGVMESSMTAVFVSLGVPLEPAVVAVLIYRVAYYLLPLVLSVFFFHSLMLRALRHVAGGAPETAKI